MNLRQLYYFKELVEQKQFLKAAKNLNISQPSLSNSLKSLENELDCQLINRSGGQIFLTEYGKIFYKTAISSVSSIEEAKLAIKQQKLLESNIISLASIPTAYNTFLLTKINAYQQNTKSTAKFIYYDLPSLDICSGLRSGKYDLGICAKDSDYSDLTFIPLYEESIILIAKNDNPLAKKKMLSLKELGESTILTYVTDYSVGRTIAKELLAQNNHLKIKNIANDDISLASAVISNNQVAAVIDSALLKHFNVTQIPFNFSKRTVYLAYNEKKKRGTEALNLIEYLKQTKKSLN